MTQVLLFHHVHGLTSGFLEFAEVLRHEGHNVHVPDLFEGCVFDNLEEGVAFAEKIGFSTIIERGVVAAEELPGRFVCAGFSMGVLPAQKLAQTNIRAIGALLFHACVPFSEFGTPWPKGVGVQIHGMDHDKFFIEEGDIDAARVLVKETTEARLFLYPGEKHLFADRSLPSYDEDATALLTKRYLASLMKSGSSHLRPANHRIGAAAPPPVSLVVMPETMSTEVLIGIGGLILSVLTYFAGVARTNRQLSAQGREERICRAPGSSGRPPLTFNVMCPHENLGPSASGSSVLYPYL